MQLFDKGTHQVQPPAQAFHFAPAKGRGQHVGAQLDPVGHNGVCRAVQAVNALHNDLGRTVTFDLGPHGTQTGGQIHDFRLARGVADHRGAPGQRRRHQDILGRPDRGKGQINLGPFQPARRLCVQITLAQLNLRAQFLQPENMQIHRPRANRTTTGQGHFGMARARQERPQHKVGGAHLAHDIVIGMA